MVRFPPQNEPVDRVDVAPPQDGAIRNRRINKKPSKLVYFPPAFFALAHILLLYFGLKLTYSSSFIMLKGELQSELSTQLDCTCYMRPFCICPCSVCECSISKCWLCTRFRFNLSTTLRVFLDAYLLYSLINWQHAGHFVIFVLYLQFYSAFNIFRLGNQGIWCLKFGL